MMDNLLALICILLIAGIYYALGHVPGTLLVIIVKAVALLLLMAVSLSLMIAAHKESRRDKGR